MFNKIPLSGDDLLDDVSSDLVVCWTGHAGLAGRGGGGAVLRHSPTVGAGVEDGSAGVTHSSHYITVSSQGCVEVFLTRWAAGNFGQVVPAVAYLQFLWGRQVLLLVYQQLFT